MELHASRHCTIPCARCGRSAAELTRLLLPGQTGISGLDDDTLRDRLRGQVVDDFNAGRVTLVEGWILSLTEARQCALLTLAGS